jgi:hypothetical protein
VTLGPDEETHELADIPKLSTGDVLSATQISIGKLVATYDEPLVPGQLYLTIAGLEKFGYKDDRIDVPGYIELKGTTVKDSEETERIPFSFDATLLTRKFWREISEVHIYNIEPENATLTISSVAGTMQQIPDQGYIDYDTIGGRSSFWELEEYNLQTLLQQLLPVSKVVETEPTMGFQLDVFREWLLVNATGFAIDYADVVDYAIEKYRPYLYVLTSDSMLNIYNKLPEYPDLNSMRLLKNRTAGPKTVIYASYEEGVLGDQIRLSAKVLTKSKPVAFYYIQGAKPHHDGELQYISTEGVWGATIKESRVSMVTPTVNPPYKPYLIDLEEGGCYTFVLTTRYSDGTEDKDVKIIWSRYKMPIASFDLMAVDATLTTPRALCFDYNHRLWLGGSFGTDFKFKNVNLHADLMLIDYDKKLLYLREEYGRVWIGENAVTTTTTTTADPLFFDEQYTGPPNIADGGGSVTMLWDGGTGRWTPSTGGGGTGVFAPGGGWEVDYRPEEMRIIWGGDTPVHFVIKDTNNDTIGEDTFYYSGELIALTWGNYDLGEIQIIDPTSDFFVTHFEFRLLAADVSTVDVYTTNNIDDYVGLTGSDWATIQAAATGDEVGVGNNDEVFAFGVDYNVPDHTIRRAFLQFHLSLAANQEIVDAHLFIQSFSLPQALPVVHESTIDEDALTTADYNAFTGSPIAIPLPGDFNTLFYQVYTFTPDGIVYLNSGKDTYVSLCLREHSWDYLNVDPITFSKKSGMSFSGGSNPPFLRLYVRTT